MRKQKKRQTITVCFRMPIETKKMLEEVAFREHRSQQGQVAKLIEEAYMRLKEQERAGNMPSILDNE